MVPIFWTLLGQQWPLSCVGAMLWQMYPYGHVWFDTEQVTGDPVIESIKYLSLFGHIAEINYLVMMTIVSKINFTINWTTKSLCSIVRHSLARIPCWTLVDHWNVATCGLLCCSIDVDGFSTWTKSCRSQEILVVLKSPLQMKTCAVRAATVMSTLFIIMFAAVFFWATGPGMWIAHHW